MNWTRAFNVLSIGTAWALVSTWMLCWAFGVPFSARLVVGAMVIFVQVLFVVASCGGVMLIVSGAARAAEEQRKRKKIQETAKNVLEQLNQRN